MNGEREELEVDGGRGGVAFLPETREASSQSCRGCQRWRGRSRPHCRTSLSTHTQEHNERNLRLSPQSSTPSGGPLYNNSNNNDNEKFDLFSAFKRVQKNLR